MKSILFVSHTAELNGAELWLLHFLKGLDRQKFDPLLVVPNAGPLADQSRSAGIESIRLPFKWWLTEKNKIWKQPLAWLWNLKSVGRIVRLIKNHKVDLLFSNSSACFSGALAARIRRIPHVWAVHEILGGPNSQLALFLGQKVLIRLILRLSCCVVASSKATGEYFGGSSKVRLIYSGIELPSGIPGEPRTFRNRFHIAKDDVVFGVVGRICDEKGQMEMVQALAMVDKDYPHLKLLFAGRVTDAIYYSRLKRFIARANLGARVIFAGFQKDIVSLIDALDCLFVASKTESFGRTIIEAMSVRTPVVAVRSGGIPEIISPGKNGFLLKSRDPKELKTAMVSFFHEREAFERAADEGVITVQRRFLLDHQIRSTESVLEECIQGE